MAKLMPNERIVTIKLKRGDLCNLILAATSLKHQPNAERWEVLRVKLNEILDDFDAKNAE